MDFNEIISNVKIYGLYESMVASGYPMLINPYTHTEFVERVTDINFWSQYKDFIYDFIEYQKKYGKEKGENTKDSCCFCDSDTRVQQYHDTGKYYCSKCRHQLERTGHVFETAPEYTLYDDYVEVNMYSGYDKKYSMKISYITLPKIFYKKFNINSNDYAEILSEDGNPNNNILLHRYIMGDIPNGYYVDHINRNTKDNRLENLRICTPQENTFNGSISKNNTSGAIGVTFSKGKNKWKAYINKPNKQVFLGYYSNIEDAIKARLIAEKTMYGEFSPQIHLFEKYGIDTSDIIYSAKQHEDVNFRTNFKNVLSDMKRAKNLASVLIGRGDDNFLNGVIVQFDLKFTVKAWTEAERYHFLEFVSSMSSMHRLTKMDYDKVFCSYVTENTKNEMKRLLAEYNNNPCEDTRLTLLYNCPVGLQLTARMTTNYRQLKTIYRQRKNHALPEWKAFCKWIETLPWSELIIANTNK